MLQRKVSAALPAMILILTGLLSAADPDTNLLEEQWLS